MQAQKFVVFIYGINIPGAPFYSKATIVSKLTDARSSFKLLAIGPRPDSFIIETNAPSISETVGKWVEGRLLHPTIVRTFEAVRRTYVEAYFIAERRYACDFDRLSGKICLNGVVWELGAVFAASKIKQYVEVVSSMNLNAVGSLGNDTVIVLKRARTFRGTRIMWGEHANRPVREAWERDLGLPVLCTSRSIAIVGKLIKLGTCLTE